MNLRACGGRVVALIYALGGVLAYISSGFVADWLGRRLYLLILFPAALAITWATYLWTGGLYVFTLIAFLNGVITLGFGFSWMAIYPVELFTASVRSTAASVIFNGARLIAWVFPVIAGTLVAKFGGITHAALIIGSIYAIGLFVALVPARDDGKTAAEIGSVPRMRSSGRARNRLIFVLNANPGRNSCAEQVH